MKGVNFANQKFLWKGFIKTFVNFTFLKMSLFIQARKKSFLKRKVNERHFITKFVGSFRWDIFPLSEVWKEFFYGQLKMKWRKGHEKTKRYHPELNIKKVWGLMSFKRNLNTLISLLRSFATMKNWFLIFLDFVGKTKIKELYP